MGCGFELGLVDQPIQREKYTSFPKVEASSIKGTLRHEFRQNPKVKKQDIEVIFGPEESATSSDRASSISVSDGRLLLFPIKSSKGVFAWITCPKVLAKFFDALEMCNPSINIPQKVTSSMIVPEETNLFVKDGIVLLEEYAFKGIQTNKDLTELTSWISSNLIPKNPEYEYIREKIKRDVLVLEDDDFRDFVNLSTEVITRTKINPDTGTVEQGALFNEEYLPVESVLYSLVMTNPMFFSNEKSVDYGTFDQYKNNDAETQAQKILSYFKAECPTLFQMGGNATTGKGLVTINWIHQKEGVPDE